MIIALLLEETKTFGFKLWVNTIQGQVFNTVVGKSPYKSYLVIQYIIWNVCTL